MDGMLSEAKSSNILLAMPIFNGGNRYQLEKVVDSLRGFWHLDVIDILGDDNAATFVINGETIALGHMSMQIPWGDIEGTAKYAYNWPSALKDLEEHTGHAIVSIQSVQTSVVNRFKILSKVLISILTTSEAIGIYQGGQSLLIPKRQYISHIAELQEDSNPISLWIYLGLGKSPTGNNAYTYGLRDFGKKELEIVGSKLSLEELFDFLYNIAAYVIDNDVTLKDGETMGVSAQQKIAIKLSKGQFVDGQSLKLEI